MSLVLNVEILGEFKKLTEATKGSEKSLNSLDDNAKKMSKGINTALGAIGIGFSLNFLVDQFKESTKAAVEDAKSKTLLTESLKANLNATEAQVDGVEAYITKTMIATSVTDDQLRPAFSKLAIATRDSNEAMRLMTIATDVAAGTGKSLDTVVNAMAKSLAGSDAALGKLVPSVRNSIDPMGDLEKMFKGAAEAAANTDPYARLQIILGEMQESIGEALLPILQEFSTWLATPEGQEKMQSIVDGIVAMVEGFGQLVDWLDRQVIPTLEMLTGDKGFGAVITTITNLVVGLGVLKVALMFFTAGNPVLAGIVAGLALIGGGMFEVYNRAKEATKATEELRRQQELLALTRNPFATAEQINAAAFRGILDRPTQAPTRPTTGGGGVTVPLGNTNININVNRASVNANDLITDINNALKNRGLSSKALK